MNFLCLEDLLYLMTLSLIQILSRLVRLLSLIGAFDMGFRNVVTLANFFFYYA